MQSNSYVTIFAITEIPKRLQIKDNLNNFSNSQKKKKKKYLCKIFKYFWNRYYKKLKLLYKVTFNLKKYYASTNVISFVT
jgi:hypothetical protein